MRSSPRAVGTVRRVSPRAPLRLLAACLLSTVALAACTSSQTPDATPSPTVDAATVNHAMAAVSDSRRVAAEQVDAELRAAVRVEPLAMELRSPSSVDAALEEVPAVVAMFERTDPAEGAAALDRLDAALEAGQDAVTGTLAEVDPGSWHDEFLIAQQEVLAALAVWSQASREVQGTVEANWELWQQVVADAVALDENRWRYRTPEEAAGTWEIEVGGDVDELAEASAALGDATDARDEAATDVAAADRRAAEVFADRPSEQPATSP